MQSKKVIIVDKEDKAIGSKKYKEIRQKDIYRVSALWIENSKGDILLAQRKFNKVNDPGKWGPAVSGTIEEGETYDSNIYKEAEEEIGLKNQVFTKDRKVKREGEHNFFCQWYYLMINKELGYFKIQEEEVEQIKWFDEEDLREEIKSNPKKFTPSMKKTFKVFNNKN